MDKRFHWTKGNKIIHVSNPNLNNSILFKNENLNNSILLKSVSYCYCYCSATNGISHSESRALSTACFLFQSGLLDTINLDDCTGMFVGEVDTGEPFSIGIKMPSRTYFLKADNRLEMDNWFRVFRPFIQAAGAYAPRPHRWSSSSDGSITMSGMQPRFVCV